VLALGDMTASLPGAWNVTQLASHGLLPANLRLVRSVVSAGHFLPAGNVTYHWSRALGARYLVVQHGLLTPHMAPLPYGAHLLAFTERDADFWRSGRTDVTTEAIGSELLWRAAQRAPKSPRRMNPTRAETPVFLGQLHGAELPRGISGRTAAAFCKAHAADYRPHPAEVDKLSRLQHAVWKRSGIRFASASSMLDDPRPVVSIFSTGVLEAAAAGVPSWVTCVRPPFWVQEFWERYGLRLWGGEPTPAPRQPDVQPARIVAERALDSSGG
jgi:hypothetical protein